MNTLDHPHGDTTDDVVATKPVINGFYNGSRPALKEPALYLSIAIVFIASAVCFSKTPALFWLSLSGMSALALGFHFIAERLLFRANNENESANNAFEGVFVITLGSIVPGLSLLAYGVFSLYSASVSRPVAFGEEFAKLALLLVVPFFNFVVWAAVRKRYLVRPRLIGLMNGFAFGLSVAWVCIWFFKVVLAQGGSSCKFGWMLLLCTAPFLNFAASCLGLELWNKTEASIRRVTMTFAVLGVLLSSLFVFAPLARAAYVQSLLTSARGASTDALPEVLKDLRSVATDEDLLPSRFPLGGFALAEMLMLARGLETNAEIDNDLYFKITGKPVNGASSTLKPNDSSATSTVSPVVGVKMPGLSLARSQMAGSVDAVTYSGALDWTLVFHNSSLNTQEARCEISLPSGAVVSRATLWIDGEPRDGAFAATPKVQQAYRDSVGQQVDPLLVTMTAPDKLLVQCFPVTAGGGEMKVRLGFKLPLETSDGKTCTMKLPKMVASNFSQSRRQRLQLTSHDVFMQSKSMPGVVASRTEAGNALTGIFKTGPQDSDTEVVVQRNSFPTTVATLDWYSKKPRYIVQSLQETTRPSLKRLFVVVDSSASLSDSAAQIRSVIAEIPAHLKPDVVLANTQGQAVIRAESFVGGQDNWATLRETVENAAERANSAVLWIHGPQPVAPKLTDSSMLDLVHPVRLYDLQIVPGENMLLSALRREDASSLISCESIGQNNSPFDLSTMKTVWQAAEGSAKANSKHLSVRRTLSASEPPCRVIEDRAVSAQATALWAREEVAKLIASGDTREAQMLGTAYRLVTPVTGAVVLEKANDYKPARLLPGAYKDAMSHAATVVSGIILSGGLVGAPVDPRYGQGNEVGQLADYGYDNARDTSRLVTILSMLIAVVIGVMFVKGKRLRTRSVYAKAIGIAIATPLVVHLIGTHMINSCGGLGGGL